jgi:hypothetical protein
MQGKLVSRLWSQPSQDFPLSKLVEPLLAIEAEQVCLHVLGILPGL